jgi:hypothetical protein
VSAVDDELQLSELNGLASSPTTSTAAAEALGAEAGARTAADAGARTAADAGARTPASAPANTESSVDAGVATTASDVDIGASTDATPTETPSTIDTRPDVDTTLKPKPTPKPRPPPKPRPRSAVTPTDGGTGVAKADGVSPLEPQQQAESVANTKAVPADVVVLVATDVSPRGHQQQANTEVVPADVVASSAADTPHHGDEVAHDNINCNEQLTPPPSATTTLPPQQSHSQHAEGTFGSATDVDNDDAADACDGEYIDVGAGTAGAATSPASGGGTTVLEDTADDADAMSPHAEQPKVVRQTAVQPAHKQPAAEQPTAEQPTAVQPAVVQPTVVQHAAEQPTAERPTAVQPAVVQPTTDKATANDALPPVNVPPSRFDDVRQIAESIMSDFGVELIVPPPGDAVRFVARYDSLPIPDVLHVRIDAFFVPNVHRITMTSPLQRRAQRAHPVTERRVMRACLCAVYVR